MRKYKISELPHATEIPASKDLILPVIDRNILEKTGHVCPLYQISVDKLVDKIAECVSDKSEEIEIIKTENGIKIKKKNLEKVAHEIWAASQLLPNEGIEDAIERIVELLKK